MKKSSSFGATPQLSEYSTFVFPTDLIETICDEAKVSTFHSASEHFLKAFESAWLNATVVRNFRVVGTYSRAGYTVLPLAFENPATAWQIAASVSERSPTFTSKSILRCQCCQ